MVENTFKIYNASAGSGKTYTLTKEYLKIVLSSNEGYRQILAVTFTNKAVNEMKERILDSLFVFSKTTSVETAPSLFLDLLEELQFSLNELQKKAKVTLKKILHNYAFFDVSTIDKFTHRLIRTFAKDLKLPQNFEVVLDRDLLLDEAVSRLINKAGSDSQLTKVLIDFALEKIDDDKSWDIALDLNAVGGLIFSETNARHLEKFKDKSIADFLGLQKTIQKKISALQDLISKKAFITLKLIADKGLQPSDFYKKQFPDFMVQVSELSGAINFKAKWKNNFEESPLYTKSTDDSVKTILDSLKPVFAELLHEIKSSFQEILLLKNVYKNIVPLTVLNAIQQEVKTLQSERDQLSISEFNTIISNEIKDQPAPFIYERLGEKYRHYFIDEFQDTSELQWNNLIPLIDNALSSEVGSLFLVGDAKQAIYRWRGGKAEQFLNLVNSKTNPFVIQPQIEPLPANYRSHEEIIKFNNDFFTSTSPFLNSQVYESLFADGNKQEYNELKNGLVQLTFLEENEAQVLNDQYCQEVFLTIQMVIEKKFSYSDICILVRGNKEGVLLANFLSQQEVPIISSESLLLKSSPKVQFLLDLLRFQNQPDAIETAFELLSFLCKEEQEQHLFIARHLKDIESFLNEVYDFDFEKMQQLSVYDILEFAIKQFDLAATSDAYINFFMDTVLDVEQKEGTSIPIFLTYWEKKKDKLSITAPASINAVQIMTIHKSKGLEFEIVIYPFAHSKIYSDQNAKLWLPVKAEVYDGFDEVLINKKQEVINYSSEAATIYEEEENKLELDAFNVLYVALTRAVKALYVITKNNPSSKVSNTPKNYSELFIHFLKEKGVWEDHQSQYEFGNLDFPSKGKASEESKNINYQYSYKERGSFKILTNSGRLWDTHNEAALSEGNLLHHIMGLIETEKDIENALAIALRNGDITADKVDNMLATVSQIINHSKLKLYFEEGITIKNEKDIITKNGSFLRPDRVVIKENKATVMDYKTGKRDIRYKDQIESYAEALQDLGLTVENKIIVYIDEEIIPEFI